MNLLAGLLYDPSVAVGKATNALLAMTAIDTSNCRLTFTAPRHGQVLVRLVVPLEIANGGAHPWVMLGVLDGSTIRGRVLASIGALNNSSTVADSLILSASFIVSGLPSEGIVSLDAAYGIEIVSTSAATMLKFGGPDDAIEHTAWGGISFEVYDPQPVLVNASTSRSDH